ncbi:MAG TPA: amidohydrolase family protein [Terriglobia bacterium]|nr:amidohydrolase family protein [Terriglobia bacterium]
MNFPNLKWTLASSAVTLLAVLVLLASMLGTGSLYEAKSGRPSAGDLAGFSALAPIDVHAHLYKDDPAFGDLMQRLNLRILDICVIDDRDPFFKGLEPQRSDVLKVVHSTGKRAVLCTTFSPYGFEEPGFSQHAIKQLDADFTAGAIAVKIYKVMGMEMKSKAGKYVMPDDPAFEPIYKDIAVHHRTLVAHIAEPDSCWQPPNPASPDYEYYQQHPQEYAYAHPDWPSKAAILAARDHLLAKNPTLRVIGAHLGSMEAEVNQMAERFDRYPNFAVDTAARVPYFMLQPRDKVRAFLIKYQDRILYGTDLVVMPNDNTEKALAEWNSTYERDWKFFSSDQTVEYRGHAYRGLALPNPVLRKIFHDNAVHWLPGIIGNNRTVERVAQGDSGLQQSVRLRCEAIPPTFEADRSHHLLLSGCLLPATPLLF